jgi:hypothetical protein
MMQGGQMVEVETRGLLPHQGLFAFAQEYSDNIPYNISL